MGLTEKNMGIMRSILYAVETGGQVYGQVDYDNYTGSGTNSSNEKALTIGGGAFYATNAKILLEKIQKADPSGFKKLDTAGISSDLKSQDWTRYDPGKGSEKAKCIQAIINTESGRKCQDEMMDDYIESYVKNGENLGVSDQEALMMCANIEHLGGLSALKRVIGKTQKPYTLDNIMSALKTDQSDSSNNNQVGDRLYWSRHEKVYGWIKEKAGKTMGSVSGLIKRAEAEIGYIEKASASDLDSKTGNKGTANYTKYSRDINNLGLMGCQAQPWCATFQFWLDVKEFGLDLALDLWHMTKETYVGYNVFETRDCFPENQRVDKPEIGCLVVFTQSHMGRVVSISGNTFETIEGNTSPAAYDRNGGQVARKTYKVSDNKIDCFLLLDYDFYIGSGSGSSSDTDTNVNVESAASFDKNISGNYVTTSDLNIRSGAGTSKKILDVLPKGTAVKNYGYYTAVSGTKWLLVKYGDITGFCSEKYLSKSGSENSVSASTPTEEIIKAGQIHANNFCGLSIGTDGIRGSETEKAAVKVLQNAMNLDYNAGLTVDGIAGSKTKTALDGHTVRLGETQYMVTALQILLLLKGYNPNGVESPGSFGNGCLAAVKAYQKAAGLTVDGIAGYNTFMSLIS